jgi:hypothetical protein
MLASELGRSGDLGSDQEIWGRTEENQNTQEEMEEEDKFVLSYVLTIVVIPLPPGLSVYIHGSEPQRELTGAAVSSYVQAHSHPVILTLARRARSLLLNSFWTWLVVTVTWLTSSLESAVCFPAVAMLTLV